MLYSLFCDLWSAKLPPITQKYRGSKKFTIDNRSVVLVPGIVLLSYDPDGSGAEICFSARGFHLMLDGEKTGIQIHRPLDHHDNGWIVSAANGYYVMVRTIPLKSYHDAAVWGYAAAQELTLVGAGKTRHTVNRFHRTSAIDWSDTTRPLAEQFAEKDNFMLSVKRMYDTYQSLLDK